MNKKYEYTDDFDPTDTEPMTPEEEEQARKERETHTQHSKEIFSRSISDGDKLGDVGINDNDEE